MEAPPRDPDDWTDEQWQAYLAATAEAPDSDAASQGALGFRKLKASAGGSVVGAAMMGIEQALYGEKAKEEVVAEAESDDPEGELSSFDPDDPGSATIALVADPDEDLRGPSGG